ncbi:MAG TPA: Hsp20 family protein [Polyangiales bacterium]|nr:Hsp20 family protein [Polyangiales bacterium]
MAWGELVSAVRHKLRRSDRTHIPVRSQAVPDEWLLHGPVTTPPIDVFENDREFLVQADVPGATRENILITCDERGKLSLWVKPQSLPRGMAYSTEYRAQAWHRGFTLPDAAERRAARAELADGVLTIRIPKRVRRPRVQPSFAR